MQAKHKYSNKEFNCETNQLQHILLIIKIIIVKVEFKENKKTQPRQLSQIHTNQ